jgi:translation initiation factor 2B subunit (eIF-2B alpha/beta/delta family)
MNEQEKEGLDELLHYHSGVIGSARLTVLGLKSLISAVNEVKAYPDELKALFDEVLEAVRGTRPKLIALIDLLTEFEEEFKPYLECEDMEVARAHAARILGEKVAVYEGKRAAVTRHGLEHIANGDSILVHSASSVVTNILLDATREQHKIFRVLVLQLDPIRTPQVAQTLYREGIPHLVVPMHDLCHYQDQVDKLFVGALTVTPDRKIIAPKGTASVLAICHLAGIKSYLFANTLHYSRGSSETQQILQTDTEMVEAATHYPLRSHSHDLVDLTLFDIVVNEFGLTSFANQGREEGAG